MKKRAAEKKLDNIFVVDGLLEEIPFNDEFADQGWTCFGDMPELELGELERVTKRGGMIILCPGYIDEDNECHAFLVKKGFAWPRFLEPGDVCGSGYKRKYWKGKIF